MNNFFTFLLLTISSFSFSQITVTSATFPEAGDTLKTILDVTTSVDINPSSGSINALWDFTALTGISQEGVYDDAVNGVNYAEFTSADLVMTSLLGENYYTASSSKLKLIGFMGPDPLGLGLTFPVHIDPVLTERISPLDFSDSYNDNGSAIIPISVAMIPSAIMDSLPIAPDSLRILLNIDRTNFVDGWGVLQIPNGTYYVLREKRVERRDTRLEARVTVFGVSIWQDITSLFPTGNLGQDTLTNYNFYGETSKELIANVSVNNDNNDIVRTVEFKEAFGDTIPDTTSPNSIFVLEENSKLQVYPNPAQNEINFVFNNLKSENYNLKMFNLIGEVVWEKQYFINSNSIISEDVSSIIPGAYFYTLSDKNNNIVSSNKLIIE